MVARSEPVEVAAHDVPMETPDTEPDEAKKAAKRAKHEKKARKALAAAQAGKEAPGKEESVPVSAKTPGEDIFADSMLSDQAKKGRSPSKIRLISGIFYAYQHSTSHLSKTPEPGQAWKFNKAKQGWLMRNVWSEVEVGEA